MTSPQSETSDTDEQEIIGQEEFEEPQITGTLQALAMFSNFANQEDFVNSLQGSKTTLNALINGLSTNELNAIKSLTGKPELTKFDLKAQANQDFDIINNSQP